MRRALAVLSLALAPTAVRADQVFTRGGGSLDGEIVERGPDSIVVDIGGGTIGLPLRFVERIVPGPSPIARYRGRARGLEPDDSAGWVALGRWAREQGLRTQADEAFLQAVAHDPDDAAARQALGHVKVGEQWMTREASARARGLVSFEGRWVAPDERDAVLAERAAAAEHVQAEAEALARLRESEARAREAEAQARIAEAEARVAEAHAAETQLASAGLQWVSIAPGLGPFRSAGFHRAFAHGCRRHPHPALRFRGAIPLAGRGGAFVTGDARPVVR